jgi:hypothetical protein
MPIFNTEDGVQFQGQGQISVTAGSHTIKLDGPQVVRDLRRDVRYRYPALANDAVCYLGTRELTEDDVVEPGQHVTFSRKLGEKGIA